MGERVQFGIKEHEPSVPAGTVMHHSFRGRNGDAEHFFVVTAPEARSFQDQIRSIETDYSTELLSRGLCLQTALFHRIFLSDELNQIDILKRSSLAGDWGERPFAVSIIQQPPLPNSKIVLLAYHVESQNPLVSERISASHVVVRKNGLGHLWSTRLCSHDTEKTCSASLQTRNAFVDLIGGLASGGGDLVHNCVRTWIYVRALDVFYQGMVDERRAVFQQHGLSPRTHFIASTGIEGVGAHRHDSIVMDAYSIFGLQPHQVSYLNDFDMLCAAKDYNVTFERGTRIAYADRAHYFISGTASIDAQGNVLYPSDVVKQVDRALENIDSLLRSGSADLVDLMYLTVYLRDSSDFNVVKARLNARLPGVPAVIVQASVCRPEWLVEIEGFAITGNNQPTYPSF